MTGLVPIIHLPAGPPLKDPVHPVHRPSGSSSLKGSVHPIRLPGRSSCLTGPVHPVCLPAWCGAIAPPPELAGPFRSDRGSCPTRLHSSLLPPNPASTAHRRSLLLQGPHHPATPSSRLLPSTSTLLKVTTALTPSFVSSCANCCPAVGDTCVRVNKCLDNTGSPGGHSASPQLPIPMCAPVRQGISHS